MDSNLPAMMFFSSIAGAVYGTWQLRRPPRTGWARVAVAAIVVFAVILGAMWTLDDRAELSWAIAASSFTLVYGAVSLTGLLPVRGDREQQARIHAQ